MKKFNIIVSACLAAASVQAAELKESKFTQVVNEVNVVSPTSQQPQPAKVESLFRTPDIIRTGANSRAELQASDRTLTRVGANTVFSFEPAGRNIKLEQGSLLFHSPKGKGGGNIKTGAATAAVLGTTLMVATAPNGALKVIFLEGRGRVTLANGRSVTLRAGQMVLINPGDTRPNRVYNVDLNKIVNGSSLVNGFQSQLPTWDEILVAVQTQQQQVASGRFEPATAQDINGVGDPKMIDPVVFETGTAKEPQHHPPSQSPPPTEFIPGDFFTVPAKI